MSASAARGWLGLLMLVVGMILLVDVTGLLATITGIVLVDLAAIALVASAFLLVGEGRERERLHRREESQGRPPAAQGAEVSGRLPTGQRSGAPQREAVQTSQEVV